MMNLAHHFHDTALTTMLSEYQKAHFPLGVFQKIIHDILHSYIDSRKSSFTLKRGSYHLKKQYPKIFGATLNWKEKFIKSKLYDDVDRQDLTVFNLGKTEENKAKLYFQSLSQLRRIETLEQAEQYVAELRSSTNKTDGQLKTVLSTAWEKAYFLISPIRIHTFEKEVLIRDYVTKVQGWIKTNVDNPADASFLEDAVEKILISHPKAWSYASDRLHHSYQRVLEDNDDDHSPFNNYLSENDLQRMALDCERTANEALESLHQEKETLNDALVTFKKDQPTASIALEKALTRILDEVISDRVEVELEERVSPISPAERPTSIQAIDHGIPKGSSISF